MSAYVQGDVQPAQGLFVHVVANDNLLTYTAGEGTAGAHALMAMSTQRRTLDFDREFNELKEKLPQPA